MALAPPRDGRHQHVASRRKPLVALSRVRLLLWSLRPLWVLLAVTTVVLLPSSVVSLLRISSRDVSLPWRYAGLSPFAFVTASVVACAFASTVLVPRLRRSPEAAPASAPVEFPVPAPDGSSMPPARRPRGAPQPRVAGFALVVAVAWIAYAHPGAPLTLAVLAVGLAMLATTDVDRHQATTMVLALGVGFATVDYVSWRVSVTNWHGWWIAIPILVAEAFGAAHALGFQFTIWPRSTPPLEATLDPTQYPIFVFVPTLNEGVGILRKTLNGCVAARSAYLRRHPHANVSIVVCNDGRAANAPCWRDVDKLVNEFALYGVKGVTRRFGGGAKAGNIEHARQKMHATGDALVVIFDADQIPDRQFLLKTVAPFADASIGWVQTGQYYSNLDNPVARWADDQQSMFYNLLCPGKAALNAAFICGTNVVIRAAALDEIGGLPQDSVTEDFAASIALHPRWRSVFLRDVLAKGLGPLDIPSYLKQQSRWALGTLEVFRRDWRAIILPKKNGLRPGQRVQYLLACTHYLCGLRDLVYMVSPALFIFTGIPAVRRASLSEYLWHFIPYAAMVIVAMWYSARRVTGWRGMVAGFGSFPALVGSLAAVTMRRKASFVVTSKERNGRPSLRYLVVYLLFVVLCVTALGWTTRMNGAERTSLFISVFWIVYSLAMLGAFLGLAYADLHTHAAARVAEPRQSRRERAGRLRPVRVGLGALIVSTVLASVALTHSPTAPAGVARPFVIASDYTATRRFGVSLPIQLLRSEPPQLERSLGIRFSIVGRTQDVIDKFDTGWARQLAAQGARPWITLEFGEFGAGHTAPLSASLPAIYNGLHDRDIRRWATEIRDFGGPVYMTVLKHADKNWSISSGVAHGGIPADVPRAWLHVRSIFRDAGAKNVAWVWAPADPNQDQAFAPPASSIDAVLQSFINYPGARWGNPKTVLDNVSRRYPGKPLFVEVSAAGPAAEKSAWLYRLGSTVATTPQLYALLYHEGGPALLPTPSQQHRWSLASDSQSLMSMRRIVANLDTARGIR